MTATVDRVVIIGEIRPTAPVWFFNLALRYSCSNLMICFSASSQLESRAPCAPPWPWPADRSPTHRASRPPRGASARPPWRTAGRCFPSCARPPPLPSSVARPSVRACASRSGGNRETVCPDPRPSRTPSSTASEVPDRRPIRSMEHVGPDRPLFLECLDGPKLCGQHVAKFGRHVEAARLVVLRRARVQAHDGRPKVHTVDRDRQHLRLEAPAGHVGERERGVQTRG